MSYSYFIKQDTYNKFYKNFWTDYFVYQYKASPLKSARGTFDGEFKIQGSDALMPYTTWSEYRKRLGNVLRLKYPNNPFVEIYPESIPDKADGSIPAIHSFRQILKERNMDSDSGVHFVTWDSKSLRDNPLHHTYRCCKPSSFPRYLKILHYSQELKRQSLSSVFDAATPNRVMKDTDIRLHTESDECSSAKEPSKRGASLDTFRNSLYYYERLGLLSHCEGKKSGLWKIPETTLTDFFSEESDEKNLIAALQFFSNILPFGSVGVNLLRRLNVNSTTGQPVVKQKKTERIIIGSKTAQPQENNDIFRYKHQFVSQALNDYNVIDLLYVIESSGWCRVEYRHPIRMELKTFICYPLQIRSSADDGRQYVFCFEPTRHSLRNVRIDQIESVTPISKVSCSTDSKYMRRLCCNETRTEITAEELTNLYAEEIDNSKEWLRYCWGASAFSIGSKIKKPEPDHLKVTFSFDPEKEIFIVNRLKRERRFGKEPLVDMKKGTITFEIDVMDAKELNKWIKSFFRRVHISSIEPAESSARLMADFQEQAETYRTHNLLGGPIRDSSGEMKIPDDIKVTEKESFHYHIFNEFMSDGSEYMVRNLYSEDWKRDYWFNDDCQQGIDDLRSFFSERPLPAPSYKDLFCSLIPLLEIEKRWLLSMLQHPLAVLFFDKEKIAPVRDRLIAGGVKELLNSEILYSFGQHSDMDYLLSDDSAKEHYIKNFRLFSNAAASCKPLLIEYMSFSGNPLSGAFYPLRMEYSLREKRFRVLCCEENTGIIYTINLERLSSASAAPFSRNIPPCGNAENRMGLLASYIKTQREYVVVRFTDGRNTADRILNEFSSYRKCCTKNRETGVYTMVLWFDSSDCKDIAIRLMGYGAYAEADGDGVEHSNVRMEILSRLEDQERLNRQLEGDNPEGESV